MLNYDKIRVFLEIPAKLVNIVTGKNEILEYWKGMGWKESSRESSENSSGYFTRWVESDSENVSLLRLGLEKLIGRRFINYDGCLGTYGMGGPGFYGFLLDKLPEKDYFSSLGRGTSFEELVFAVWGADEEIVLDEKVIQIYHEHQKDTKSWMDYKFESQERIRFHKTIIGGEIKSAVLKDDEFNLDFRDTMRKLHRIEFKRYDSRRPVYGNKEPRVNIIEKGVIGNYVLITPKIAEIWV